MGLIVCLLGMAQSAHALGPVCTEQAPLSVPDELRDGLGELDAAAAAGALPPAGDDELPWCASAEDPRCSPLPAHSTPPELAMRVFAATALADRTTLARASACEITHVASDGLPPASGVHARVERPPR